MSMGPHVAPAPAHQHQGPFSDEPPYTMVDRMTKGGRRLWYKLTVIQQPKQARACGSGPKSSADRRPVDPPPVVELKIFEGHTWQEAESKDITFLYNANLFLYVTLEHARVIAHGRVQTPAANQPPVLTGMPVSAMAYLDRPQMAGYFLFPDLSVRHEGQYKLNFILYEETKDDADKDPDTTDSNMMPGFSQATGGSFDFRMDAKSRQFSVYSAKKFPGLAESTHLSRVVAEQGCRVRIRRDIRMRKRDAKPGAHYDDSAKDDYPRHRRTETPETNHKFRPRSMSGSMDRGSFSGESQRRPSGADYPPPPPSFSSQQHQHQHQPQSAGGHLQFLGNANAPHSQYPQQGHQASSSRPPSMPPSPSAYQTSHGSQYSPVGYQQQQQHQQHQHAHASTQAHQMPQQQGHHRPPSYSLPSYQHQQPERSMSQSHFYPPNPPVHREAPPAPSPYRRSPGPVPIARAPSKEYNNLNTLPPFPPFPPHSVPSSSPMTLPPIASLAHLGSRSSVPSLSSPIERSVPPLQPMAATTSLPPPPPTVGSKRTRDDFSRYDADIMRCQNGARQDPQTLDAYGETPLSYRRANGAEITIPHDSI